MRAAAGLEDVAIASDPATLRDVLSDDPLLLACDVSDVDLALEWSEHRYPNVAICAWSSGSMDALIDAARAHPRLVSLVGWPAFASMPRPWEISLATRRLLDASASSPRLGDVVLWGSTIAKYRPRTTDQRDAVVAEVVTLAERAGASSRLAQRIAEVAHELLMNAMYDAPLDAAGAPRYAHDRKQEIELDENEVPTFRFAVDGVHVALQCVDPFGGLRRRHVLDGIVRGRDNVKGHAAVIDTSNGGAGLGLYRIYSQCTVMIVDVEPGGFSSVSTFFDLDVNPREARSLPVSLHLWDRSVR